MKNNMQHPRYLDIDKSANLEDIKVFAELVRVGRKLTGESLRDLAKIFNASPGTISRWENEHTMPAAVVRPLIINYFAKRVRNISKGKSAKELLEDEEITKYIAEIDAGLNISEDPE